MSNAKPLRPTLAQRKALEKLWAFVDNEELSVFILKGYAGTGKTSLMKMFITSLGEHGRKFVLLASTGRAAKILSDKTEVLATTVHSQLYSFSGFNQDLDKMAEDNVIQSDDPFLLQFELKLFDDEAAGTVFIIDESSMISDKPSVGSAQAEFGTGNLLQDLFRNTSVKFIFIGDECQLPPVNGSFSPALNKEYIEREYGLKADEFALTEILRQSEDNDIVVAADRVRELYANPPVLRWARFPLKGYQNIQIVRDVATLTAMYVADIKKNGYNASTLITGSNKLCASLAKTIRPALGFNSNTLERGELLLVTQNNLVSGLMNGDLVKVIQIGLQERRAGLTFVHVEIENISNGHRFSQLLVKEVVDSAGLTNTTQEQHRALYIDFTRRMARRGVKTGSEAFVKETRRDPYLNALKAVYGYALTCHKAQGGEWKRVYLNIPSYQAHQAQAAAYQWLYTALTRAVENLYVADDFFISY